VARLIRIGQSSFVLSWRAGIEALDGQLATPAPPAPAAPRDAPEPRAEIGPVTSQAAPTAAPALVARALG